MEKFSLIVTINRLPLVVGNCTFISRRISNLAFITLVKTVAISVFSPDSPQVWGIFLRLLYA